MAPNWTQDARKLRLPGHPVRPHAGQVRCCFLAAWTDGFAHGNNTLVTGPAHLALHLLRQCDERRSGRPENDFATSS